MKLKTMFVLAAVLFLLWGLVLFFSDIILRVAGAGITPGGNEVYLARAVSSLLLGMAVLAWMARNAGPSQARNAIVACFVISNALAVLASLIGLIGGTVPQAAWVGVVANSLFAIGFALTGLQAK
jgi:hypothetical protein